MTSCIKLPVACSEWNGHPLRLRGIENSPAALSNATQIQLDAVTRERDALRCMVVAQTGQKRKEPSDVSKKKTLDPRKRLRLSSPEDKLHAKISELEGFLSKVLEESKARRNSDQLALFNMRTCLKDLMDQANVNQELIRKLESDVSLKEKAIQTTSTALDARNKEIAIAENTIGNIGERLKYLEHDRKYLKADVRRYRANAEQIQAYEATSVYIFRILIESSGIINLDCVAKNLRTSGIARANGNQDPRLLPAGT
ncbi:hypothetical protein DFH09DRAFT_1067966 [Mycena vulgaris]|nr:hypothetical protein DFH09DRAFT_1067966 [Mycena vulgaris]